MLLTVHDSLHAFSTLLVVTVYMYVFSMRLAVDSLHAFSVSKQVDCTCVVRAVVSECGC